MRAVVYSSTGGPEVLRLVDRPEPSPGPGEVLVRVAVSGVNPTDWKARRGSAPGQPPAFPEVVPNQDGAGTIEAVGLGVDSGRAVSGSGCGSRPGSAPTAPLKSSWRFPRARPLACLMRHPSTLGRASASLP